MNIKPFSADLFNHNDPIARKLVMHHINQKLWRASLTAASVIENPDIYGVDLVSPRYGFFIEVGVKHSWHGPTFSFTDVQVEQRKWKYEAPGPWGQWGCVWYLNHDMTHAIVFDHQLLQTAQVREIKARYGGYSGSSEPFKFVSVGYCLVIKIDEIHP